MQFSDIDNGKTFDWGNTSKDYMGWLPYEDAIAGKSEEIILKHNPNWSSYGDTVHPVYVPEELLSNFDMVLQKEFRVDVTFSRESWHGRMRACRGVGAAMDEAQLQAWNEEHMQMLQENPGRDLMMEDYMRLREFKQEDAKIIAGWLRTEEELYRWSADRFNKYPLSGEDINESYTPQIESGRFFPLTLVDDNGDVSGHFIIRYPREDDDSSVRFGFVIVDPSLRGKGYGKKMLQLGIEYVREKQLASRIDLGVFENNEAAKHCYEAVGFREYSRRECEMPIGTWTCIDMEIV